MKEKNKSNKNSSSSYKNGLDDSEININSGQIVNQLELCNYAIVCVCVCVKRNADCVWMVWKQHCMDWHDMPCHGKEHGKTKHSRRYHFCLPSSSFFSFVITLSLFSYVSEVIVELYILCYTMISRSRKSSH